MKSYWYLDTAHHAVTGLSDGGTLQHDSNRNTPHLPVWGRCDAAGGLEMRYLLTVLCCSFILVVVVACRSTADDPAINQDRAAKIVMALDQYKLDHGQFPRQMNSLIPIYLQEIPKTTGNKSFTYTPDEVEGYYLCFDYRQSSECCYMQRLQVWDCSPGCPE